MNATFYKDKATLWVFWPKPECPLSYTDLLVYSYLAYKDSFPAGAPSLRKTAAATGLSVGAVQKALQRLANGGYYRDGKPVAMEDVFFSRSSDREHWCYRISYWQCLLPSADCPLTIVDMMVLSYIYHQHIYEPGRFSPSYQYVANATCLTTETVRGALQRLQAKQLFRLEDNGDWRIADPLTGLQLLYFRPKSATGSSSLGTFIPDDNAVLRTFTQDDGALQATEEDGSIAPTASVAQVSAHPPRQSIQSDLALAPANQYLMPADVIDYVRHLDSLNDFDAGKIGGQIWLTLQSKQALKVQNWKELVDHEYNETKKGLTELAKSQH
jgi:DNA-binding MarR family transcriptional regulator